LSYRGVEQRRCFHSITAKIHAMTIRNDAEML